MRALLVLLSVATAIRHAAGPDAGLAALGAAAGRGLLG